MHYQGEAWGPHSGKIACADGYDNPIVCIPALLEDEDDEDPDAIPPPLDDEDDDDVMADSGKGKERA